MSLRLRRRRDGTVTAERALPDRHHFDPGWVTRAATDGYATLGQGRITLHLADGDTVYRIVRAPGAYAESGERIGDGPANTPEAAAAYREAAAGDYEVINYWDCEREDA